MLTEWHCKRPAEGVDPQEFVRGPKFDYDPYGRSASRARFAAGVSGGSSLRDDSITGLWGGTTDVERRLIRRLRVA